MIQINKILEIQMMLTILEVELSCSNEIKVYPASWIKGNETIFRDAYGRFASEGTKLKENIENKKNTIEKTIAEIKNNPKEFKRKINTELLVAADTNLQKLVKANPKIADQLTEIMFGKTAQQARDQLADLYEELNPGLPNAIKPNPFKEFFADLNRQNKNELIKDLRRGVELAGYNYNQLLEKLNNVESDSEAVKLLGKLAATSIPIAGYLAVTLAPEVAIGLLLEESVGTVLTSLAITQSASFTANRVLDKAEVKNPVVRLGVDLAIAIAANPTAEVLNVGSQGIKGLAKSSIPEDIQEAAKAYTLIGKNKVKEALKIHSEGVGTIFTSLLLNAPINRVLLFKQTYLKGIKSSAKKAQELSKQFMESVPDNLDYKRAGVIHEAEHITILSGGFAGRKGRVASQWHRTMREEDELFENHHLVRFNNEKFDLSTEAVNKNKIVLAINNTPLLDKAAVETFKLMLGNVFKKGHNPAAIEMAAQAYAYHKKHDKLPVNIIAHSGGGMIANEAVLILKEMGIEVKAVNLGSPNWGLLPKNPNIITLTSELDTVIEGLPIANPVMVNSVESHAHYWIDKQARKNIKAFLENKPVEKIVLKEEMPIFDVPLDDFS